MRINSIKNLTIAAAVPLSFQRHPNHINNKQQSDRFEKQKSNTKPEKIFTAIIIPAAVLAIGVLTLALTQKEKTPEPQTSAHKALKDASNGIFWLKSKEEISKSIKISQTLSREKLDGKRTGDMLLDFLNSDVRQFQYHAYNVFTNIEHDKMTAILKPYLEDRNLQFHGHDSTNLRAQIFSILKEKGTGKDIELLQPYLNPKDEWYKLARESLDAIAKRSR